VSAVALAGEPAYTPWPGCETVEYRNPAGETLRCIMRAGAAGRMMPPIQTTTVPVPGRNGSRWLGARHLERIVTIPTVMPGTITDRAELRRWAHVLDPTLGEGTLTVVDGPHAGRFLRCCYDAGLDELAEELPHLNLGTLLFRAAWPYWLEGIESSVTVQQGATTTHWFPFLPLILGASDAFAVFTITITGDVPSWPVVTVLGPGTDVTVQNLTTGLSWTVSGALAAGSTLEVDTRPGVKTVQIDGLNAYPRLTPTSSLWPLEPGPNRVQVSMALTDVNARVTLAYRNQWLAA
jgi:hypothetical protein